LKLEEDRQRHEFKEGEENLIIFTQVSVTVTSEGYLKLVFKSVVEEFVTCGYKLHVQRQSSERTIFILA